jgi:hypothetical protein
MRPSISIRAARSRRGIRDVKEAPGLETRLTPAVVKLTMNEEDVPNLEVTLDTSILHEYWKDQPKKAVVERLLALAEENVIDLAVTARVHEDIPDEPLASRVATLPELGVQETGSVTRLDHWVLGRDQLGSDEFEVFRLELESARKESDPRLPDWRDWDHLHAHMLQGRTAFLTWDGRILDLSQVLQARFGIRVQAPEGFLAEIATDAAHDD